MECCGRAWGVCVCTRPIWNTCCTKVPDVDCEKVNAVCAALKAPLEAALQAALHTLDLAKAVLSAVKRTTLEDAQRVYDAAVARVKKLRHEVDSVCSYRKCERGIYSLVGKVII